MLDISVRYIYAGLDNINLDEQSIVAFSEIDTQIVNFTDEASCAAYLTDNHNLSAYMPYVRDVFSTVQKYDIVVPITYIMSDYSIPSFFDDGYFKYTFPYCNTVPVSDFSVDADYEKLDENLWRWVRTEKISMSEEIDGVMTHWVEEYNIPVRISDVYVQPNDFVGYIDLDNIPDYDVSKTYQVCKYNCDNNDYIVEDVEVINGEYVFIDYDFDVEYWFLIEVTNVIESRDSGDSNDDVEQTLDELAGDDGDIDLSDPETAVKFFWEVAKYEFGHMFDKN